MRRLDRVVVVTSIILFLTLVMSLIIVLYPLIQEIIDKIFYKTPEKVEDEDRLLVIAKATELSTSSLVNASNIAYESIGTMPDESTIELLNKYISISKYNINKLEKYLKEDPMLPTMYRQRMLRSISRYKCITFSAERLCSLSQELYHAYKELQETIKTKEFSKIQNITNKLENSEEVLKEVLRNLEEIPQEDILSEEHWERVKTGLETTKNTLKEVNELKKLSQLLQNYPQLAELSYQLGTGIENLAIALSKNDLSTVERLSELLKKYTSRMASNEDFPSYYNKIKELNPEYAGPLMNYVSYLKQGTPDPGNIKELMRLFTILEEYAEGKITYEELIRRLNDLKRQGGILEDLSLGLSQACKIGSGATKGEERPRD